MRYALFSDVHANLPALEVILTAFDRMSVDRYVCVGDVIGYGPHPAECVAAVEALRPAWVLGNHELMLLGHLPIERTSPLAQRSLRWTRSVLPAAAWRCLGDLPLTAVLPGGVIVTHGSLSGLSSRVRQRATVDAELARFAAEHPTARILVLGHTHHVLLADERGMLRWPSIRRRVPLDPRRRFVLNPGSVGQSRGLLGHARAAVLDTERNVLELLALRYETSCLTHDLETAGFPAWSHHRSPVRRLAERVGRKALKLARR